MFNKTFFLAGVLMAFMVLPSPAETVEGLPLHVKLKNYGLKRSIRAIQNEKKMIF